jgi:hypothetical protein
VISGQQTVKITIGIFITEDEPLAAGTRLDRYEIISQLGVGGRGEVYLAEDTRLHRRVALKIFPSEVASHSRSHASFLTRSDGCVFVEPS